MQNLCLSEVGGLIFAGGLVAMCDSARQGSGFLWRPQEASDACHSLSAV